MKKVIILLVAISLLLIGGGVTVSFVRVKDTSANQEVKRETIDDIYSKIKVLDSYFLNQYPILDFNSIDNNDKLYFSLMLIDDYKLNVSKKNIHTSLTNYFGKNFIYEDADIFDKITNLPIYVYNLKKQEYRFQSDSSYSLNYGTNFNYISSFEYEETDKGYVVYQQVLFMDENQNILILYSNLNDYLNKVNSIGVYDSSQTSDMGKLFQIYYNQIPKITYEFELEDYYYIIKSVKY